MQQLEQKLKEIVGDGNFSEAPEVLKQYSTDYSFVSPRIANYLVKPKTAEEVSSVIKLANESNMPVIPTSSKVHCYGATVPSYGGIVMDLTRMNRILRVDERNRKVVFEAGVNWGELQSELAKHGLMALNPLFPPASKSALTSMLEREPPLIPKFEHSQPIMSTLMVLPNGEIFATGAASVPNALEEDYGPSPDVDLCHPFGPGINWYRLVQGAQGTMGVTLWVNAKTTYLPQLQETYLIPFEDIRAAVEYIYRIQRRMIGNECFLLNRCNLANVLADRWPEDFEELMKVLPPFALTLVLDGGQRRQEQRIEYQRDYLNSIGQELVTNILPTLPSRQGEGLEEGLRVPWPEDKPYWKARPKGSFQDVFFHTPMDKAPLFTELIYELAAKHEYPKENVGIYLQPKEYGRVCHYECNLFYDSAVLKEAVKVEELYHAIVERSIQFGAFFTRPYDYVAKAVYDRAGEYTVALRMAKDLIDPNHIMNPGKLCF